MTNKSGSIFHEQHGLLIDGRIPIDCFFERKIEPNIDELREKHKMPLARKAIVLGREVELPDLNSLQSVFEYVMISLRSQGIQSSIKRPQGSNACQYRYSYRQGGHDESLAAEGCNYNCACAVGHMIEDSIYDEDLENVSIISVPKSQQYSMVLVQTAIDIKKNGKVEVLNYARYCNLAAMAIRLHDLNDDLLTPDFVSGDGVSRVVSLLEKLQSMHDTDEKHYGKQGKEAAIRIALNFGLSWTHIPFLN